MTRARLFIVAVAAFTASIASAANETALAIPGETLAAPKLQSVVLTCLSIHEGSDKSGCRTRHIVDTKVSDRRFLPLRWTETWKLYRCGRIVKYKVFFGVIGGATNYVEVSGGTSGNWVVANDGAGNVFRFDGGPSRTSLLARELKNLVKNGSFERATDKNADWTATGTTVRVRDSKVGSRALRVIVPVREGATTVVKSGVTQNIEGIKANENVSVSFWAKTKDVVLMDGKWNKAKVFIEVKKESKDENKDENKGEEDGETVTESYEWPNAGELEGTSDWTRYQKKLWISESMVSAMLGARSEESHGEIWFDDIMVVRTPEYILNWSDKIWAGWRPELATEGPKLSLVETERKMLAVSGRSRVTYKLVGSKFPKDKRFVVWNKRIELDPVRIGYLSEYYVDGQGRLVSSVGGRLARCRFYARNFLNAEPFEMALFATGQDASVFAKVIPFPIEAESEYTVAGSARLRRCRIWLEMTSVTGDVFVLYGEGYGAGEEIDVGTQVKGGRISWETLKASSDGKVNLTVKPKHGNEMGGDAIVTVNGKHCHLYLVYEWGTKALAETGGLIFQE